MNITTKITAFLICVLISIRIAEAEEAPCASDVFEANYEFTLTYSSAGEKEYELIFVSASRKLSVSSSDPELSFNGRIVEASRSGLVIEYNLQIRRRVLTSVVSEGEESEQAVNPFQTVERRNGGLQASVRLRFDRPLTIFKAGEESVSLRVSIVE